MEADVLSMEMPMLHRDLNIDPVSAKAAQSWLQTSLDELMMVNGGAVPTHAVGTHAVRLAKELTSNFSTIATDGNLGRDFTPNPIPNPNRMAI